MHPISTPVPVEEFEVDQPEEPQPSQKHYDYFLVLDVEATCVEGTDLNWPNEIIVTPCLASVDVTRLTPCTSGMACSSPWVG